MTLRSKILYGEIICLSNKEGYCFANNSYFAKLYNCTNRTIQNALSKLQKNGYIKIMLENNYKRKIFLTDLKEKNLKSKVIVQVHDELLIETPLEEKDSVKDILKTEMENVIKLDVPLKAEVTEGFSWYEAK